MPASTNSHVEAVRRALASSLVASEVSALVAAHSLKVSRLLPSGTQAQLMSFPPFDPFSFAQEEWQDCNLKSILEQLLIIGLKHQDDDTGGERIDDCVVLGAAVCVPDEDAWGLIELEWREAKSLVAAGRLDALRKGSEARCVFVKRHGSGGSRDEQAAPGDVTTPALSFWLTAQYLRDCYAEAGWREREEQWPIGRPRIFVATASAPEARHHFEISVARTLDEESVSATSTAVVDVQRAVARSSDEGVRLWGAKPGPSNRRTWDIMRAGDWLFFYWDKSYTQVTRVLEHPDEPQDALADAVWGRDPSDGQTWELAYFIDRPEQIQVRADEVSAILGGANMGFRSLSDERLVDLVGRYGSVKRVVEAVIGNETGDAVDRAMQEWERELDPAEISRIDALHEEMRAQFATQFGSEEAIDRLTPGAFFAFMNRIDARSMPTGQGIFRFNIPFPVREDRMNYRYLADHWAIFQAQLKILFLGRGSVAARITEMMGLGNVSYYTNPELAVASALLSLHDPEAHAGVQRMEYKRSKSRAAGVAPDLPEDVPLGEEFEALESAIARLPAERGRDWSWATRMKFFFSDAFQRNLEATATPQAFFVFSQKPEDASEYGDEEGARYRFDSRVTGRKALREAGQGRFVYYRPRKGASAATAQTFFGAGDVLRVETARERPDGVTEYVAELGSYVPFDRPVPRSEYQPPGWNHQHAIAAISREAYEEIMSRAFGAPARVTDYGIDWLERETLLPREHLNDLIQAIGTRQVVFAGPPGTGKTWLARALVRHLCDGDLERMRIVQFHPSYGYEEFMEGLRPTWDAARGGLTFNPVDGVVLRLAEKADSSGQTHYLIIDEMNRANLSRVFGELMFLFEYRNPDDAVELQYSGYREDGLGPRLFYLPEGLRFIGTMNTADRSIRSIDTALRRRFEIFECQPDAQILHRWYERPQATNEVPDLIDGFERLNGELTAAFDRHHTVGHTFFMADRMTRESLVRTWDRQLRPLIEEYFFDEPDRVADFTVETFWPSIG